MRTVIISWALPPASRAWGTSSWPAVPSTRPAGFAGFWWRWFLQPGRLDMFERLSIGRPGGFLPAGRRRLCLLPVDELLQRALLNPVLCPLLPAHVDRFQCPIVDRSINRFSALEAENISHLPNREEVPVRVAFPVAQFNSVGCFCCHGVRVLPVIQRCRQWRHPLQLRYRTGLPPA